MRRRAAIPPGGTPPTRTPLRWYFFFCQSYLIVPDLPNPAWPCFGTIVAKPNYDGGSPRKVFTDQWVQNGASGPEMGMLDSLRPDGSRRILLKSSVRGNTKLLDLLADQWIHTETDRDMLGLDWRDAIAVFCQGGANNGDIGTWLADFQGWIADCESKGCDHFIFAGLPNNQTTGNLGQINDWMEAAAAANPAKRSWINTADGVRYSMQPASIPHYDENGAVNIGHDIITEAVRIGMDAAI
jgi:hypothetical protein